VVKLLTFDLSLLVPVCLAAGTFMFMATERRDWRQFGRILVGIGLLLLSLEMIGQASEPLRQSTLMPADRQLLLRRFRHRLSARRPRHLAVPFLDRGGAVAGDTGRARLSSHPSLASCWCSASISAPRFIAPLLTRNAEPGVRVVPIGNL